MTFSKQSTEGSLQHSFSQTSDDLRYSKPWLLAIYAARPFLSRGNPSGIVYVVSVRSYTNVRSWSSPSSPVMLVRCATRISSWPCQVYCLYERGLGLVRQTPGRLPSVCRRQTSLRKPLMKSRSSWLMSASCRHHQRLTVVVCVTCIYCSTRPRLNSSGLGSGVAMICCEEGHWGLLYDFSVMCILFMYCCKHVRLTCV